MRFNLIVIYAFFLFSFTRSSENIQQLSLNFSSKILEKGKYINIEGEVYFKKKNGVLTTRLIKPFENITIVNGSGEMKIYDPLGNTIIQNHSALNSSETSYLWHFLNGAHNFTVNGIKKRPGVVGTWTKTLIYKQLPKGVLEELEKTTPTSDAGNKLARLHQSLTPDVGNPHLTAQINQMVTLFMLSDNMKDMWNQFRKLKERQAGQMELPFEFDKMGHTIEPPEHIYNENELSGFNKKLKIALDFNPKN